MLFWVTEGTREGDKIFHWSPFCSKVQSAGTGAVPINLEELLKVKKGTQVSGQRQRSKSRHDSSPLPDRCSECKPPPSHLVQAVNNLKEQWVSTGRRIFDPTLGKTDVVSPGARHDHSRVLLPVVNVTHPIPVDPKPALEVYGHAIPLGDIAFLLNSPGRFSAINIHEIPENTESSVEILAQAIQSSESGQAVIVVLDDLVQRGIERPYQEPIALPKNHPLTLILPRGGVTGTVPAKVLAGYVERPQELKEVVLDLTQTPTVTLENGIEYYVLPNASNRQLSNSNALLQSL